MNINYSWKHKLISLSVACLWVVIVPLSVCQTSCKKLIEVGAPVTGTNGANVYNDDVTAIAAVTGIYSQLSASTFNIGGLSSMSLFPGLSADELDLYSGVTNTPFIQYYTNSLSNTLTPGYDFWTTVYPIIFVVNSAIEGLDKSTTLTPTVKRQLLGECKFIRAFCYFYLTNLYGDVPLALNSDWKTNATLSRNDRTQVWQQIIEDLQDGQQLLNEGYVKSNVISLYPTSSAEKIRPNKWAATALLSRAYLYTKDYAKADEQATDIINQSSVYKLSALSETFKKNSSEAIWQLQPVKTGQNTQDALLFIIPLTGPNGNDNPVFLSKNLLNSFEPGDQRRRVWVDSVIIGSTIYYYPYKYKLNTTSASSPTEYLMVLRLSEQYLIRAEARAMQGNIPGAAADLDTIRNRGGLSKTTATSQASLMTAILHERQDEFFTEWGHRWLDLIRTNSIDAVMSAVANKKGGTWETTDKLYPIPIDELRQDRNLVQNPGY